MERLKKKRMKKKKLPEKQEIIHKSRICLKGKILISRLCLKGWNIVATDQKTKVRIYSNAKIAAIRIKPDFDLVRMRFSGLCKVTYILTAS